MFPEINIEVHLKHYNALQTNWFVPVLAMNPIIYKMVLHSRRSYWGRNPAQNMRVKITFEQIIQYEPFDIITKLSLMDNCPPIQHTKLQRIQDKIKVDYQQIINESTRHDDKWLNDVFLFGSIVMTELNGTFGIINHYNGTGEIRDPRSYTRTIYRSVSVLKGFGNVTLENIGNVIKLGMSQIKESTLKKLDDVSASTFYDHKTIKPKVKPPAAHRSSLKSRSGKSKIDDRYDIRCLSTEGTEDTA